MPAALAAKQVDAISSGEPFMGQTELDGYGRILYLTKDVWPGFISCVLAVREDVIAKDRAKVQALCDGIAKSGVWLDRNMGHRMQAAVRRWTPTSTPPAGSCEQAARPGEVHEPQRPAPTEETRASPAAGI
jgi:ABC-type nitrate/sulfonate/bicarbonate transport system substrate-binding protein